MRKTIKRMISKEEGGILCGSWEAVVRTLGECKQSEDFEQRGKLILLLKGLP